MSRHDVVYVTGVLSPDVKASFGGDEGIAAFKRIWTLDRADSELWRLLTFAAGD